MALAAEGERAVVASTDGKVRRASLPSTPLAPFFFAAERTSLRPIATWQSYMGTAVFMLEAFVKIHMLNRDRCELIWPTFHKVGAPSDARELGAIPQPNRNPTSLTRTIPRPCSLSRPTPLLALSLPTPLLAHSLPTPLPTQHVSGILCPNGTPVNATSELVERAAINTLRLTMRILHREDLLPQVCHGQDGRQRRWRRPLTRHFFWGTCVPAVRDARPVGAAAAGDRHAAHPAAGEWPARPDQRQPRQVCQRP